MPLVEDRVRDRLGQLSVRLSDADWLDGAFSAGDLMMVSVLLRLKSSGILDGYPNLAAYVARGEARPAYKRAFDAQLPGYTGKPRPPDRGPSWARSRHPSFLLSLWVLTLVSLRRNGLDLDFNTRTGKRLDDQKRGGRVMIAHDAPWWTEIVQELHVGTAGVHLFNPGR